MRPGYEQMPPNMPPMQPPQMPLTYSPMSPHMGPYHPMANYGAPAPGVPPAMLVHPAALPYGPHGAPMGTYAPEMHQAVPPPPPPHPQELSPIGPHGEGYPLMVIPGGYPGGHYRPPTMGRAYEHKTYEPAEREELRAYPDDTTLMLRNLPNKITQKRLLERMENYRMAINFLYLPTDFENKCNLGYAFMNFRDGLAAARFAVEFDGTRLVGFRKSNKVLAVQPARVQGLAANVRRFRNSSVMGVLTEEEKPLLLQYGEVLPFPEPDGPLPPVGARRAPRKA